MKKKTPNAEGVEAAVSAAKTVGAAVSAAKPSRRVKMLVRRHLRLIARGKASFDKANESLALAINCGLQIGQPIELEIADAEGQLVKEQFYLVNNFDQEVVYKPARVAHYEFKKVPKTKRGGVEAAVSAAPASESGAQP